MTWEAFNEIYYFSQPPASFLEALRRFEKFGMLPKVARARWEA